MMKKTIIAFLISIAFLPVCFAAEVFEAGISHEDATNVKPANKPNLPIMETGFYDLYYAINYKPLGMLSVDEAVITQSKAAVLIAPLHSLINPPSTYNISAVTGKIKETVTNPIGGIMAKLRKNPNSKELLFAYAIELKKNKEFKRAMDVVNAIIDRHPDYALAHYLKGDLLRYKNKLRESVNEYLYAVELNPYLADAYFNIAKILEMLDDKKLALDYYKMAYKINPNDKEVKDIILKSVDL